MTKDTTATKEKVKKEFIASMETLVELMSTMAEELDKVQRENTLMREVVEKTGSKDHEVHCNRVIYKGQDGWDTCNCIVGEANNILSQLQE